VLRLFDSRRDIDPVAVAVVVIDVDIAGMTPIRLPWAR